MSKVNPFHIAIPVHNLDECRTFYRDILNCEEGRSSDHWVDFSLFGHQLVIHYKPKSKEESLHTNPVDGKDVPVPHYGVVLDWDQFENFAEDLKSKKVKFVIEPYIRFAGQVGEQATMFFYDPAGNALEFKSFKDMGQLFAK
ncbi:VOC family protein [Flavobacteriaceae bacterium KMM 6897]|uniref:VOC family protein n=1 Tax=Sediminicola sp. YIK13 TaxID=1453352 RepID=UPI00071F807D|nr:VOC family protein [Sediminicola sp. YIK13]ALM07838.1 glyoxalase [Sediminicola sp. YIK13]MEB8329946.1 VOC family protein [Flavobacteriaceae bacterium KMM 6897]MEB8344914.1 VOC family protein [Flavobacteriaceae bacterium KMM 6898]